MSLKHCTEPTIRHHQSVLQAHARKLANQNILLSRAVILLEQRNQELHQFIHIIAHDLKAPLRSISNLSQWIETDLGGIIPDENQQQLQLLRSRTHRMETMISSLLEYVRVGRDNIELISIDLAQLLAEIIDSLAPPSTMTIEIQPQMPKLMGKRLLLSQVFTNLIGNAIRHHHLPDGNIKISGSKSATKYQFAIADNGPGIDPEYHDRIFVIFQTLKDGESSEHTGIGLSIVKKIVEAQGGEIWLESVVGEGTTFFFTWPLDY